MTPKIAIVMGSKSDWDTLCCASELLTQFQVSWHAEVVSAHRAPERLFNFASNAKANGIAVIIAAAGGAAHLPGMVAALTPLPVLGVPVQNGKSLQPGRKMGHINFFHADPAPLANWLAGLALPETYQPAREWALARLAPERAVN